MIFPTVHLNGTHPDSLSSGYASAARAAREAIQAIEDAAPNARDYYPQGDDAFRVASREHQARAKKLNEVYLDLMALYEHVEDNR